MTQSSVTQDAIDLLVTAAFTAQPPGMLPAPLKQLQAADRLGSAVCDAVGLDGVSYRWRPVADLLAGSLSDGVILAIDHACEQVRVAGSRQRGWSMSVAKALVSQLEHGIAGRVERLAHSPGESPSMWDRESTPFYVPSRAW